MFDFLFSTIPGNATGRRQTPRPAAGMDAGAPKGLTLVELLVALALALAMTGLAYALFADTQQATRAGIDRSTIMQEAYVCETRLRMDFSAVVGPQRTPDSAAGAILIIPGMRRGTLPVPGVTGEQVLTRLRSDQLVVFYDAQHGGLIRDTGGGVQLKSLTRTGVKSAQAKIWMGHVRRSNGESASALDWVVGRQATLLVDDPALAGPTGLELAPGLPPSDPRAGLSPVNSVSQMSDVVPFGQGRIANWMRGLDRSTPALAAAADAKMVAAFAVTPNDVNDYTNQPVVVTQPLSDSVLDATDLFSSHRIFLPHRSEFIVQYSADLDADGLIDTTDASIPHNPYKGTIKWYPTDADVFDGVPSALKPVVFYPNDDQARVVHLGYYQGPDTSKYTRNKWGDYTPYPAVGGKQFGDSLANLAAYNAAMAAYAARHNGSSPRQWVPSGPLSAVPPPQSQWPQLIRIRYRLHDPRGQVISFNEEFPFNHRDDDGDGVVDNPDGREARCSGIWFEHIFSIPYPRVN